MRNILLFALAALSSFGIFQVDAIKGCQSKKMNDLCLTKTVDHCYTCIDTEESNLLRHPPVCVPIFHDSLGALENFPSNKWNCTIYTPSLDNKEEIIKDVCDLDKFIVDLCNGDNKDGICLIANYVNDLCNQAKEEEEQKEEEETVNIELDNADYSQENFLDGIMLLYPACDGPICEKEGWSYHKTIYGKNWCGNGECQVMRNRKIYCDVQNICGIKRSVSSVSYESREEDREEMYHKIEVMSCGKQKFKCMLSKGCRNLLRQIEECNNDYTCMYPIFSSSSNEAFNNLANCMYGK